jgi:AcrR family transcriptional regulator
LLDASERVFARRGYRGASLDEIAAEAGYSKGAVYSNFASKEDLFLALLDAHVGGPDGSRPAEWGLVAADGSPSAALTALATPTDPAAWEWGMLTMEFFLYAAREPAVRERLAAVLEQQRLSLASTIEAAWPQLASAPLGPRDIASVVMALSTGLGVQVVLDPKAIDAGLFPRVLDALVRTDPAAASEPGGEGLPPPEEPSTPEAGEAAARSRETRATRP